MPFMQVGTSCDPAVSRGIDYTFTWKERFENIAFAVLAFASRQIPGPASYGACSSIQGSQALSRYGDRSSRTILPSVLPSTCLYTPGGLHRFEPVIWSGLLPPRAM